MSHPTSRHHCFWGEWLWGIRWSWTTAWRVSGKSPPHESAVLELSLGWANSQGFLGQAPPLSGSQFPHLSNQEVEQDELPECQSP